MAYRVKLEGFEGPFDLLLHLIAKRELDIYDVSLAAITEEYLACLSAMEELDLEVATEFLVVAATLIEIKASRLLPGPPVDEEDALALSDRDLLIARLLEYRAFKDAAAHIADAMAANAGFVPRAAGPGAEYDHLAPDILARVSLGGFAEVARAVLQPRPGLALDLSHITPIRVTVADAVADLLRALGERPRTTFRELTSDCRARIDVVVWFLAVLELVKRDEVDVRQPRTFGDIVVERTTGGPPREIDLGEVDAYDGTMAGEGGER